MSSQGIRHGDRFFIADIDPSRPGLEGYGIQQDHPDGMLDYYYDAATGELIWTHSSDEPGADAGRGMVADIDPRFPGMETWSINGEVNYEESTTVGLYNAATNTLAEPNTDLQPWPHMGVWWDGDPLRELFNADPFPENRDARIEKWDPANPAEPPHLPRVVRTSEYGAVTAKGDRVYPLMIADTMGDWREEVILTSAEFDELVIFTTDQPTDIRLYTLAHNPAYRNEMTTKGYLQSSNVDYFLGHDMVDPPAPNIRYATEPDDERPVVDLVSPVEVGPWPELSIHVDASDNVGLSSIVANIYRGNDLVQSTSSAVRGVRNGSHRADVTLPDGHYRVRYNAHDTAGNVSWTGTQPVTIDSTAPQIIVKTGDEFTRQTGSGFDLLSVKLYDSGRIDRVELNGVGRDLVDAPWSDLNFIEPGVHGAVEGENVLVVYDVAGNAQSFSFELS